MFLPLVVFSQRPEKIFLKILDVYLENELPRLKTRYHCDKDKILLLCGIDTIMISENRLDYAFFYKTYSLEIYPVVDSVMVYKGVKMLVSCPKEIRKKLFKHFKPFNETWEVQEDAYMKRFDPVSNVSIQMNNKFEIYYFITPDDTAYYNGLKKKRIKFSEKVISISPLPVKR